MAKNSGRGNPIDADEGHRIFETDPPPLSSETKAAVSQASSATHASGRDAEFASNAPAGAEAPWEVPWDAEQGKRKDAGEKRT